MVVYVYFTSEELLYFWKSVLTKRKIPRGKDLNPSTERPFAVASLVVCGSFYSRLHCSLWTLKKLSERILKGYVSFT
tara:strand:- start:370 stop:600 length:231 start_codon:yes stop_codon:yes gene_type:complete